MTCVPYNQWLVANAACKAASASISVKGFGYVATGRAGLRNLGDLSITGSITPQSAYNFVTGQAPIISSAPSAPPVTQSTPSINTTPVDPNDPCYIASLDSCPLGTGCPAVCPTGFHSIDLVARPGQAAVCNCTRDRPPVINYGNAFAARGTPNSVPVATAPPAAIPAGIQANASAGGFSHWGILAAVVLGGGALYYVTKKKKAS